MAYNSEKRKEYYLKDRERHLAINSLWRKNNPERLKQSQEKNREVSPLRCKLWRENNKEKYLEINRENAKIQRQKNKDKIIADVKLRKCLQNNRVPIWADKGEILKIYKEKPKGCHVDHIVPLNGKNVSGLHVEYNLQYLTPEENLVKSNKFPYGDYF